MRIGIDIDGCVRDIHSKLRQVYKREMGKEHWCCPQDKWKKYDISNYFSIGNGLQDFWFKAHAEEIYSKALPFGDIGEIGNLMKHGHEIIIITDQPTLKTKEYTLEWINRYIPYNEIHFTNKKYLVPCAIYLDDAPSYLMEFKSRGLDFVIMNHAWNEDVEGLSGSVRVDSLKEFGDLILEGKL